MPYRCAAANCRTGYNHELAPTDAGISMFQFPLNNEPLLQEWIRRLSQHDWKPTKHSRICSLHFRPEDIETEQTDSNNRWAKENSDLRIKPRLRKCAVPTIFENFPSYFIDHAPVQ